MGGELNLATREGSRDEFHGRAGLSGTSAAFLGEGPIAGGKGSWLASVRRSYLDYLIERIDPDAGFAFGFVDAQGKVVYDVTPRHQVSASMLLGRAVFDEGDPDIGENEIRHAISRAWLTTLSWRYLPSQRFAITQRLYSTGLRYDNDNPVGATLDSARSTNFGWRADASYSPTPRAVVEFGGDVEWLSGRNVITRYVGARGLQQPERLRRTLVSGIGLRADPDRPGFAAHRCSWQPDRLLVFDGCDHRVALGQRGAAPRRAHTAARRKRHLSSVSRSRRGSRAPGWRSAPAPAARASPRCGYRAHASASDAPSRQCLRAP